jgi:hypothetical protein
LQAPQAAAPAAPQQPARDHPKIAVYAVGARDASVNKAMAMRLAIALANSGRYQASKNYMEFFDRSSAEWRDVATAVSPEQIRRLGELFDLEDVCVAEITSVLGEARIFARIVNVGTMEITAEGASNRPPRSLADLTAASEQIVEAMFKKEPPARAASQPSAAPCPPPPPAQPAAYESCPPCPSCAPCSPCPESDGEAESERRSKTGFTLAYGLSGDATIFQFGLVHVRHITDEVVSLVVETNTWLGEGHNRNGNYNYNARDEAIPFYGANIPVLFKFEKSVIFSEIGVFFDALSGKNEYTGKNVWLFNVGATAGGGFSFGKGYTNYFYRFNYGMSYYSHTIGIRQLF